MHVYTALFTRNTIVKRTFCNGTSNLNSIIAAFDYCIKNEIKIVNMSFGTNYIKNDVGLENVINLATKKGMIVVASASKNGIVTYPSHYNDVISVGVKHELHLCKSNIKINETGCTLINVFACGIQRLYREKRLIHITANEPSYATAVVTALVYNVMLDSNKEVSCNRVIGKLGRYETERGN